MNENPFVNYFSFVKNKGIVRKFLHLVKYSSYSPMYYVTFCKKKKYVLLCNIFLV